MASFPTSTKTFATLVDLVDNVLALHPNERGDEITALENYLIETATEKTVSSGVLTVDKSRHRIQPESSTTDDIDTISGMPDNSMIVLYATDEGTDTLTFKHGTGNISCFGATDIALSHGFVIGFYDGTTVYLAGGGGGTSLANGEGVIKNGKFTASVSSNDLIVSLKTLAGSDPSSSDPVKIVIGGTERTVIAALSLTLADATNWFNAGSAELATKLIQYFIYLGYRAASSTVFLGLARIPYGRTYADFSATSTNEKYLAYTGSAPASTDVVCNVGRLSATLSSGAGYTWSISGSGDVVNYPIFETDKLSWTPAFTNLTTTSGTLTTTYIVMGRQMLFELKFIFGASSAVSGGVSFTIPFTTYSAYGGGLSVAYGVAKFADTGTANFAGLLQVVENSNLAAIIAQLASGTYLTQSPLSSTIPFTWTTSDEILLPFVTVLIG